MPPAIRGDKRTFFDININGEPAGRIVFALWNHCCPKTAENFRAFCTGELGVLHGHEATYEKSIFHRVIKGFMIQGGDITHKNGQGGYSIYGRTFDDENLALKHNKPYLLSMANRGPDTNGSQFFITTEEVPHLDGKHCVFGEVIKGIEVVKKIENLETGEGDKPVQKVQVVHCGEMIRKGDTAPAGQAAHVQPEVSGTMMADEPRTNNWLMRRSKSPERDDQKDKKKDKKGRERKSPDRHRRHGSRDRFGRERRSRSRSHSRDRNRHRGHDERRDERREERRPVVTSKDGVKVRGRGKLTFLGTRARSTTPPHWKKEESKKLTLEEHQKRQEEIEERKKRVALREKEDAERTERLEKERQQREAQRELDRQQEEAKREFERQESNRRDEKEEEEEDEDDVKSERSRSRSSRSSSNRADSEKGSPTKKSDDESELEKQEAKKNSKSPTRSSPKSSSKSSSSSSGSSSSGSSSGSESD